ncbi:unnamed protein product [Penicillium roqueforti FM164]|uniref:Genomic scaffold, ProqFM164S02 n=1 Tax=Penicillium roqueforti (strain FM164) TaxID=1365484 RepID=W6Q785_PENRF|nr:unnamed protein product [Penicillium roqueforti FM164]
MYLDVWNIITSHGHAFHGYQLWRMEFVPEVAKNEPVDRMEPNYDVIVDITDGRTP